jgi:hypothetical protein
VTLRRRAAGRPVRILEALVLAGVAVLGATRPATAQTTQARLLELSDRYASAKADYEAARKAYQVRDRPFAAALSEVGRARAAGDAAGLERAYREAQDRAGPLQAQTQRVEQTKAALDSTRQALIEIIEVRQGELVAQMDAAANSQQRNDLNTLYQDLTRRLQALETEAADTKRFDPMVIAEVAADPRDGPSETLAKAQIMEHYAALADTAIQDTDRRIDELKTRLRHQQQRADLMAGVERFDDTRLPVVTNPPGSPTTAADSTGAGGRPLTLEERIRGLEDYRTQLEAMRDQMLIRAQEFRRKLGSVA